jgi:non-classical export protein 2
MHPRGVAGYVLRPIQFAFAVIVLGLSSALVANQPTGGSPSQINFAVFVSTFSILIWFYIVPMSIVFPDTLGSALIIVVLDSITSVFYFAGGIALAVAIRVHSCHNQEYLTTNRFVAGKTRRCRELQSLIAFMWFCMSPPNCSC